MAEDQLRGHINMPTSTQIPSGTTEKHSTVSFAVVTFLSLLLLLLFLLKQFIHPRAEVAVVFWMGRTKKKPKQKKAKGETEKK